MKKQNFHFTVKTGLLMLFFSVVFGCGYTFAPQGEYINKSVKNIYVDNFGNKTAQAELENYVRTAFIDQFILSGRFKIVQSVELADAIVKGNILNLNTVPLSYRANTLAAEERAAMMLEVSFTEKESGKTIWVTKSITGTVDYKLEDNINLIPSTRKNAYVKLANDTAEKAFNQMMSGF
jgi:DNA-binding beta-propeller fold protein YncE